MIDLQLQREREKTIICFVFHTTMRLDYYYF